MWLLGKSRLSQQCPSAFCQALGLQISSVLGRSSLASSADTVTSASLPTHLDTGTSLKNRCFGWCRGTPKAVANGGVDVLQKEQAVLLLFPWGDVLGPFQSSQEDYMSYQLGAYAFKETDLASSDVPRLLPWEVSWQKGSPGPRRCVFWRGWHLLLNWNENPSLQPQGFGGNCLGFILVPTLNHCSHCVTLQCERHIKEGKLDCQIS